MRRRVLAAAAVLLLAWFAYTLWPNPIRGIRVAPTPTCIAYLTTNPGGHPCPQLTIVP